MAFKHYIENKLKEKSKHVLKKILFIDGTDIRAQKAALQHEIDNFLIPVVLYVNHQEGKDSKATHKIFMEDWKDKSEILINKYLEKRKGKETREQAEQAIKDKNVFAMLMVELGEVDGAVGGLLNPTADILRAAFKVIGPKPGIKTISSVMIMEREEEWYIFTDISVIVQPTKEQLVDIAKNASMFAKSIDFKSKISFLSFSTSGSAVTEGSKMVHEAALEFNEKCHPTYPAIGEVQFDAAFSPEVRLTKYHGPSFKKNPTILVFPSLEAGNIGYKIAQRMGGFGAIGPIITGINKPVNDLSRGASTEDVFNTALVTALQTFE